MLHGLYLIKSPHVLTEAFAEAFVEAITLGRPETEDAALFAQFLRTEIDSEHEFFADNEYGLRLSNLLKHSDKVLLFTAEEHVGLACHPEFGNGIRAGGVVVGLFGIKFPFILCKVPAEDGEKAVYTMVNVAYVASHQRGHDFVESAPDDAEWPDIEQYGLQRYTIV